MAIKITIEPLDDQNGSMAHELDQSLITIGRSKSCHIELDHPEISRRHCIVKYEETGYVLIDEHSRHGTVLDGDKLVPEKAYDLGNEHTIEVPGFRLRLMCDGEKPRLERTTVVARKLLDDLLQGEIRPRECPSLRSRDSMYYFKFVEAKTTFVLGTLSHVDFVVHDEAVAKKHVSFIRDIFGIRVVPTPGNAVVIDNVAITEPLLLSTGARIKIGTLEFVYGDTELPSLQPLIPETIDRNPREEATPVKLPQETTTKQQYSQTQRSLFGALDRIFVVGFVVVFLGALLAIFNLA